MTAFTLNLAGQQWEVKLPESEVNEIHLPLLQQIRRNMEAKPGRYLVLLAGPPGSGKTTLGALWEELARRHSLQIPIQTLPMDGFHLSNAALDARVTIRDGETISLRKIKGAPETYDLLSLYKLIHDLSTGKDMTWPRYDRQIHDPVPGAIPVMTDGMLIVEGNYVLLDEPGWRDLKPLADLTIFIECAEPLARQRVVARLTRGGRNPEDACRHYEFSDLVNWQRVMRHRLPSDVVLRFGNHSEGDEDADATELRSGQ